MPRMARAEFFDPDEIAMVLVFFAGLAKMFAMA